MCTHKEKLNLSFIYQLQIVYAFNIRNNNWNPSYPHYSVYTDILIKIADTFDLRLFIPIIQVPT